MKESAYKTSQMKMLCSLVGSNPSEIEAIIQNIDNFYREWERPKIDGKTGLQKTFKDGTPKKRTISPPQKRLKVIQTAIKNNILQKAPLPINIQGGVKKKNNITNAKFHQGNKYQLTTDLNNFFPSISPKLVYQTFLDLGYSNYLASWLTKLTTWKKKLPQGCPTSTHIANLAFLKIDMALIEICKEHNLKYTRFVDDLTFSSPVDFQPLIDRILSVIIKNGFEVNYRKTKYKTFQTITGIEVFNNFIDAPQRIKDIAIKELSENALSKPYNNYLNMIARTNQ